MCFGVKSTSGAAGTAFTLPISYNSSYSIVGIGTIYDFVLMVSSKSLTTAKLAYSSSKSGKINYITIGF